MSTQINQFLMYGISLPYGWHKEWEKKNGTDFYETFESFMDDSTFESKVKHKDGIFCLFDGRDGRFIVIGRVIEKAKDGDFIGEEKPITFPEFTDLEKELLAESIKRNFGVEGKLEYIFVTQYR